MTEPMNEYSASAPPPMWVKVLKQVMYWALFALVLAALVRYGFVVYQRSEMTSQLMDKGSQAYDAWKKALASKDPAAIHRLCSPDYQARISPEGWAALLEKHPVLTEQLIMQSFTYRSDGTFLWKTFLGLRDEMASPKMTYVVHTAKDTERKQPIVFVFILDEGQVKVREVRIIDQPLEMP